MQSHPKVDSSPKEGPPQVAIPIEQELPAEVEFGAAPNEKEEKVDTSSPPQPTGKEETAQGTLE